MEQQIQDLIASIKKDGIESATNESKKILEEARKEAERIVNEARKERDKIIADGKKTIEIVLKMIDRRCNMWYVYYRKIVRAGECS